MGIDKSLSLDYPIVEIGGVLYQYGKVPEGSYEWHGIKPPYPDEWLVEHISYAKDYWCFKTEQEMIDFLENLPEAAQPPMIGGHAIWNHHGMMPQEDYDQIFEGYRKYLRTLLEKRRMFGLTFPYRKKTGGQ